MLIRLDSVKSSLLATAAGASAFVMVAALAQDGKLAIVYLPRGGATWAALDRLRGPVQATWYDPTNGQSRSITGSPFDNKGTRDFLPPDRNAAGDPDFVLVLEVRS